MNNDRLQEVSNLIKEAEGKVEKQDSQPDVADTIAQQPSGYEVDLDMIADFKKRKYNLTRQKKRSNAIVIAIAEDRMSATFRVGLDFDRENPITKEEILEKIRASGVTFGIEEQPIDRFLKMPLYNTEIVFAKGEDKVDGQDGYFTANFEYKKRDTYVPVPVSERAKIDFYASVNSTTNAKKGQVLGTITPYIQRKDGRDIFGTVVQGRNSRPTMVKFGQNIRIDEKNQVLACFPGEIQWSGRHLWISEVLTVSRVDVKSGSIKFGGSVIVEGDVLDGFSIECDGDIHVKGQVTSANLTSGGNITIDKGVHGRRASACVIKAFGNVSSRFVEQATIDCYGDLLTGELINSKVFARGNVNVTLGLGKMIGGECICCGDVTIGIAGNKANILTKIELIGKSSLELEAHEINHDIEAKTLNISKYWKACKSRMLRTRSKVYKDEILESTKEIVNRIEEELIRDEARYATINSLIKRLKTTGEVCVTNEAFEEVRIMIDKIYYITIMRQKAIRYILKFVVDEEEETYAEIGFSSLN